MQAALMAARAEYERVRERNLSELQRCTAARSVDFAHMLVRCFGVKAGHAQPAAQWPCEQGSATAPGASG